MEVAAISLPRPAFVSDLDRVLRGRGEVRILIIVDGLSSDAGAMFNRWREVFSDSTIAVTGGDEAVRSLPIDRREFVSMGSWAGGKLSGEAVSALASIAAPPTIIVTCEPYDAYGTLVKREFEQSLLPFVRKWRALFLVHDAVFETLRAYDAVLLRDRLYARPRRMLMYKFLVRAVFGLTWIFSAGIRLGWRPRQH